MGTLQRLIPQANAQINVMDAKHSSSICATFPDLLMIIVMAAAILYILYQSIRITVKVVRKLTKFYRGARYVRCPTVQEPLQLLLELTDDTKTAYIELKYIVAPPGSVKAVCPKLSLTWHRYTPYFSPQVQMHWYGSYLEVWPHGDALPLPQTAPVPWMIAPMVKRLIRSPGVTFGLMTGLHGKYTYALLSGPGITATDPPFCKEFPLSEFDLLPEVINSPALYRSPVASTSESNKPLLSKRSPAPRSSRRPQAVVFEVDEDEENEDGHAEETV